MTVFSYWYDFIFVILQRYLGSTKIFSYHYNYSSSVLTLFFEYYDYSPNLMFFLQCYSLILSRVFLLIWIYSRKSFFFFFSLKKFIIVIIFYFQIVPFKLVCKQKVQNIGCSRLIPVNVFDFPHGKNVLFGNNHALT